MGLVGRRRLRGRGICRLLCWCRRLSRRCGALVNNIYVHNLHWAEGTVVAGVGGLVRDYFYEGYASVVALAEERVIPVQVRSGDLGDEELRAVGVGAGIGVGESARFVEQEVGRDLVLELVDGV